MFGQKNSNAPILAVGQVGIWKSDKDIVGYIQQLKDTGAISAIVVKVLAEVNEEQIVEPVVSWSL